MSGSDVIKKLQKAGKLKVSYHLVHCYTFNILHFTWIHFRKLFLLDKLSILNQKINWAIIRQNSFESQFLMDLGTISQ